LQAWTPAPHARTICQQLYEKGGLNPMRAIWWSKRSAEETINAITQLLLAWYRRVDGAAVTCAAPSTNTSSGAFELPTFQRAAIRRVFLSRRRGTSTPQLSRRGPFVARRGLRSLVEQRLKVAIDDDVFAHGEAARACAEILITGSSTHGRAARKEKRPAIESIRRVGQIHASALPGDVEPDAVKIGFGPWRYTMRHFFGPIRQSDGRARALSLRRQASAWTPA
jgi:hypothetical protein